MSFIYPALREIITGKPLLNYLKHLTDFNLTGLLQVYHFFSNK